MKTIENSTFDFDLWMSLAKTDPAGFERKRIATIAEFIASAPAERRKRLECLQWRIDMEVRKYRNPTMACTRIFNMMWESVYGEKGLLAALTQVGGAVGNNAPATASKPISKAKVLEFRRAEVTG